MQQRKSFKFLELTKYFRESINDKVSLTFDEIEQILHFPLSNSAYNYVAYWHLSNTHTFPNSWINEGFKLNGLDLNKKTVTFIRINAKNTLIDSSIQSISNEYIKENLNIEFAIKNIKKFHYDLDKDINGRFKSWEHCFIYFKENKDKYPTESIVDTLCLQLAFYLASWGMYRGSSFLLQKDYKVHREAVLEILKEKYKLLWDVKCKDLLDKDTMDLLIEVTKELKNVYIKKRENIDGHKDVSDILITKILMGTFGCVPAYDRYFVSGIKTYKVAKGNYNEKSIVELAKFYLDNNEQLEKCRSEISKYGVEYPQMKLIDMCFWQAGYDKDAAEKNENIAT